MSYTTKYAPDDLDRRIIAHLRPMDALALSELSDALGVGSRHGPEPAGSLDGDGYAAGFTVRVREDYDVNAVACRDDGRGRRQSTTQVVGKLRGLTEISALHTTGGNWDLVADIRAADFRFDRVLREVRMIDGIASSETSLLLSTV